MVLRHSMGDWCELLYHLRRGSETALADLILRQLPASRTGDAEVVGVRVQPEIATLIVLSRSKAGMRG
jgi:hypothetical protein